MKKKLGLLILVVGIIVGCLFFILGCSAEDKSVFIQARRDMMETQIKLRGIKDERLLEAMSKVKRHLFVPTHLQNLAYSDRPLPIGEGQTISQPYIVALMTQSLALKGDEKVLEIGTGSGYQAAILSRLVKEVYTIERVKSLVELAKRALKKLSYLNVHVVEGDGTLGFSEQAKYDAIIVTAACFKIPGELIRQLADGGRLIIPVGDRDSQVLVKVVKEEGEIFKKELCGCVFVPLVGEDGWEEE